MAESSKRIQFIVGATGTGKSSLALSVVNDLNPVILNADSVQFYKHVQIGANKPSVEELAKCPHELFSLVDYPEEATASDYIEMALSTLNKHSSQAEFLLVGGSGFYVQALEKGMFDVKPVSDEVLQKVKAIEEQGLVLEELKKLDPEAAESIHPNDHYRLQRALQIVMSEGRSLNEVRESTKANQVSPLKDYKIRKLGLFLERDELRALVKTRTEKMLKAGLLEEAKAVLEKTSSEWAPMKSIGYQECVRCLNGELSGSELSEEITQNTMALAKRQQTWFKRDPEIKWFHAQSQLQEAREYLIISQ